jgi:uncharacterized membrane protein YhaH (DUF805 family)
MFSFSGNSDRGSFVLASIGWSFVSGMATLLSFSGNSGALVVAFVVGILSFFALLSLTVRRMRDMGFSGLGMFIVIIAYTVFCWTIIVPIICWIFLAVMPSVAQPEVAQPEVAQPVVAQPEVAVVKSTVTKPVDYSDDKKLSVFEKVVYYSLGFGLSLLIISALLSTILN